MARPADFAPAVSLAFFFSNMHFSLLIVLFLVHFAEF